MSTTVQAGQMARLSAAEMAMPLVIEQDVPRRKVAGSTIKEVLEQFEEGQRPFIAHGENLDAFYYKGREFLLEGPAGTGKSVTTMSKCFALAEKYPGVRILFCRKTRVSMTDSTLVTWEEQVVPAGHPILRGPSRKTRTEYIFPNGSIIALGGMDRPEKFLSTEWDFIYVNEATELDEGEWEGLIARLFRRWKAPWNQLMGDCNPDAPTHWLNVRCNVGRCKRFVSRHYDNPSLYDWFAEEWTPGGAQYRDALAGLTGVRYERLYKGIWAQAEGVVYPEFDAAIHMVNKFYVPKNWDTIWAVDWGFTHPFVWQEWAIDPDGRAFRTREVYMTGRTVKEHVETITDLPHLKPPKDVVCDTDAGDRKTFEREMRAKGFSIRTKAADKSVMTGIQSVRNRLSIQGDGHARLYFVRDARVERDDKLTLGHPTCTEEEFASYVWDTRQGQIKGEVPLKRFDHGMDTARYLAMHLDHPKGRSFSMTSTGRAEAA